MHPRLTEAESPHTDVARATKGERLASRLSSARRACLLHGEAPEAIYTFTYEGTAYIEGVPQRKATEFPSPVLYCVSEVVSSTMCASTSGEVYTLETDSRGLVYVFVEPGTIKNGQGNPWLAFNVTIQDEYGKRDKAFSHLGILKLVFGEKYAESLIAAYRAALGHTGRPSPTLSTLRQPTASPAPFADACAELESDDESVAEHENHGTVSSLNLDIAHVPENQEPMDATSSQFSALPTETKPRPSIKAPRFRYWTPLGRTEAKVALP